MVKNIALCYRIICWGAGIIIRCDAVQFVGHQSLVKPATAIFGSVPLRARPTLPFSCFLTSEPAGFQTSLVALDIFEAKAGQAELSFLEFAADQNEALLFGFAQCL